MIAPASRALLVSCLVVGCGDGGAAGGATGMSPTEPPPSSTGGGDGASSADGGAGDRDGGAKDAGHDGSVGVDAGPSCKKTITVISAVGTGTGAVASHSNGCWTVVDADGAANAQYRKCSTAKFVVQNAAAPNYAYDDTNPARPLSEDTTFLSQCAAGAGGIGFEYMAYRGGWRLLPEPTIAAYFEELYTTDLTVDDNLGVWQATVNGKDASPMINFGPDDPAAIRSSGLAMCNKVPNHGYFGIYDGDWKNAMANSDPRAVALGTALNDCTKK